MAYLALARKWRPKAFSEVVGQTHVVQALSNALESGRVHHAFLFTGTRGVGKTTLARIFAKSLNCETSAGAEPCQKCNTCVSVDEGRYVDLIEIDAASRTKVDDTRELLESVQYAPTTGKVKVYLIDEVHMLSGHSFNALLKTLEEPPEHVKFLFATTDPQKMPVTVLSRCLQFNLRAMRPEQVENQLVKILGQEAIEFDQAALHSIAKAADGSMRDGLSLLDQAIAQGGGEVRLADVESMLGTIKAQHTEAILRALATEDVEMALGVVTDMADNAVDFSMALDDVLMNLYYVSLAQIAPSTVAATDANTAMISSIASSLSPETVQLYYQIGLISKRDIALAPSLRVGFEMALLRMLAFEPNNSDSVSHSNNQDNAPSNSSQPTRPIAEPANGSSTKASSNEHFSGAKTEEVARTNSDFAASNEAVAPVSPKPAPVASVSPIAVPTPTSAVPSSIAVTLAGNNEWGELIEQTDLIGLPKELAMNCACEKMAEDHIQLYLAPKSQHLLKPERLEQIQQAVRTVLDSQVEINLDLEESDKETPAECLARLGHEQFEQTKESIKNDPGVKAIMSEFGATLNEDSIKPL